MKYLFLIVLAVGGYWAYQNYSLDGNGLSLVGKLEAKGSVTAIEILEKSKQLVEFVCNDKEVLRSWGSNSQECFKRVSNFEDMCKRKIFPDEQKSIRTQKEMKNLMSRYNKCVLPG